MATADTIEYVSGISLGQANECTALAVLERRTPAGRENDDYPCYAVSVRHLHRFPIGTTYAAIFGCILAMFRATPLPDNVLVTDLTAVGEPVLRLLMEARIPADLKFMVITNGLVADNSAGFW